MLALNGKQIGGDLSNLGCQQRTISGLLRFLVWRSTLRSNHDRSGLALAGVILLAASLRLHQVDQPYVDEFAWRQADTASIAEAFARGNWNILLPQVRWGGPGPNFIGAEFQLVTGLAALGYHLFGPEAWVGRAVSVAFSLWGIFALYNLVLRVWDRPRAIATAAVIAVLPGAVFTDRSFLPDGAMTALMTTSLWMLVVFHQTDRSRYLWAAALFGALGCLTKLPGGILLIPALYVFMAWLGKHRGDRRAQLRLATAVVTATLPVVLYYLWARHVALSNPPYHFTGEDKFLWHSGVRAWMQNGYFLPDLWQIVASRDAYWGYGFIAFAIGGLAVSLRLRSLSPLPWLFHYWLLAMMIRYAVEAQHLIADPYNLHLFHTPVAAFAGHALVSFNTWLGARERRASWLPTLGFAASAIAAQMQAGHLYHDSYRQHAALGTAIAAMSSPGDLVVSAGPEPVVLYFSKRNGWLFPPAEGRSARLFEQPAYWDRAEGDGARLRELRYRGARWLAIPAWNAYTGIADQAFLRQTYPVLYEAVWREFEVVHSSEAGLILRTR